jgi:hypothetical protein
MVGDKRAPREKEGGALCEGSEGGLWVLTEGEGIAHDGVRVQDCQGTPEICAPGGAVTRAVE